ncbi:hypothetical protein LEP1GSC132_0710 [Leptospira kirschneri str. 200803703]|uniref:Uncharacterized protein n=1 Tax=Leptospira kirschneri str. 200802841 TaxID=1193047 RepID=A0A828Y0Y8_9LEPT|nr:hypothetical protein LEP1GSC044_1027 [Leptospira kirschneri serovar Grippotyphosa str. RM52]EKO50495.1 hypothetical protein LEP1GSC131_1087 [Leptospira kirschneri str. 200802841]EKP05506.1 hypothetical protein LEP1GSC018_3994 [Leptospira kirschneri str. 2008720114]EKQ84790.1 hypothetical protein LEP1GSC064_3062 [Leptospira kirschneri serovar Grippotyphosa str. Moskva]EKR07963.1 hypothetical protein LEP1GSC122_1951 [Leptospira kirschneri serovar Valbuzzi str. 200702274]EMJ90431.1 hypothetica
MGIVFYNEIVPFLKTKNIVVPTFQSFTVKYRIVRVPTD